MGVGVGCWGRSGAYAACIRRDKIKSSLRVSFFCLFFVSKDIFLDVYSYTKYLSTGVIVF